MALARLPYCLAVVLCLACVQAYADARIDTARQQAFSGRRDAALATLKPLIDKEDPQALYEVGDMFASGKGGPKDLKEGMNWLTRAAELGHTRAQFDLGYHYAVDYKDHEQAMKWYRLAAGKLDDTAGVAAAENIGLMYGIGQGVKADAVEAARWTHIAAEHDSPSAQYQLGLVYFEGNGVTKDFAEAKKWLSRAAGRGNAAARYTLGFIYAEGFGVPADASEAVYWFTGRRVSDAGEAAFYVGRFYSQGFLAWQNEIRALNWMLGMRGVAEADRLKYLKAIYGGRWADPDTALQWYRKGAEAGFVGAQVNLARIYWDESGRYWNCGEAVRWTKAAAGQSDPTAFVNIGLFYLNGPDRKHNAIGAELQRTPEAITVKSVLPGTPADRSGLRPGDVILRMNGESTEMLALEEVILRIRASKDKRIAFDIRRDGAMQKIDVLPEEVTVRCPGAEQAGLQRDPAQAVKWFQKAADAGDLTGLFMLAKAYREGSGVPQDQKKAFVLYEQGADRGDWEAAQEISHMYASGEGVDRSSEEAERWYRKALELKHRSVRRQ